MLKLKSYKRDFTELDYTTLPLPPRPCLVIMIGWGLIMMSETMHIENQHEFFPLVALPDDTKLATAADIALQKYLKEISPFKVLSKEEAETLALKVQKNGDQVAAHDLILANLRLVVKIALDYQKYWRSNFLDLVQEGNIGLMKAIKKFDPYKGVKFSYYAAYWIRARILNFIQTNWRVIKICTTETMRRLFFNLNKEKRRLEMQGITTDSKILAKQLKVKESVIEDAISRINNADIALDKPVQGGSEKTHMAYIPCSKELTEDLVAGKEITQKIRAILAKEKANLDQREKVILEDRLMSDSPKTLDVIAGQFSLSRERIRQIEGELLKKLKRLFFIQMPDFVRNS